MGGGDLQANGNGRRAQSTQLSGRLNGHISKLGRRRQREGYLSRRCDRCLLRSCSTSRLRWDGCSRSSRSGFLLPLTLQRCLLRCSGSSRCLRLRLCLRLLLPLQRRRLGLCLSLRLLLPLQRRRLGLRLSLRLLLPLQRRRLGLCLSLRLLLPLQRRRLGLRLSLRLLLPLQRRCLRLRLCLRLGLSLRLLLPLQRRRLGLSLLGGHGSGLLCLPLCRGLCRCSRRRLLGLLLLHLQCRSLCHVGRCCRCRHLPARLALHEVPCSTRR